MWPGEPSEGLGGGSSLVRDRLRPRMAPRALFEKTGVFFLACEWR